MPGVSHKIVGIEIDFLIFHAAPQSFNKYIIPPGALAIHADADVIVLEHIDKRTTGILAALIRVEYLRFTLAVYRFLQGIDTKASIQAVREPPAQYFSAILVHDHREINKTSFQRQKRDITGPDLIGLINAQVSQ